MEDYLSDNLCGHHEDMLATVVPAVWWTMASTQGLSSTVRCSRCMLGILESPDSRGSPLFTSSCCCSWPSSQRTPLFSWFTFSLRVFSNINSPSAWANCKSNLLKAEWINQGTVVGETEAGSGVNRVVSVLRSVR